LKFVEKKSQYSLKGKAIIAISSGPLVW